MIALIVGMPSGSTFNFTEIAADALRSIAPVRKLSLVRAPADGPLTVAQFCAARNLNLSLSAMGTIGRKASKLMRDAGKEPSRVTENHFTVNAYDADVLAQAFAFIEASKH